MDQCKVDWDTVADDLADTKRILDDFRRDTALWSGVLHEEVKAAAGELVRYVARSIDMTAEAQTPQLRQIRAENTTNIPIHLVHKTLAQSLRTSGGRQGIRERFVEWASASYGTWF